MGKMNTVRNSTQIMFIRFYITVSERERNWWEGKVFTVVRSFIFYFLSQNSKLAASGDSGKWVIHR